MTKIPKKAQLWSLDIVLGIVVFITSLFVFYALLASDTDDESDSLKREASLIIKEVSSQDGALRVVDEQRINITKLNELKDMDYQEIKRIFSVEGDFCLYLEDEQGNIVLLDDSYKGIGSPSIEIAGSPCT